MILIILVLVTFSIVFFAISKTNSQNLKINAEDMQDSVELRNLLKIKNEKGKTAVDLIIEEDIKNLRFHLENKIKLLPKEKEQQWNFILKDSALIPPEIFLPLTIYEKQSVLIPVSRTKTVEANLILTPKQIGGDVRLIL